MPDGHERTDAEREAARRERESRRARRAGRPAPDEPAPPDLGADPPVLPDPAGTPEPEPAVELEPEPPAAEPEPEPRAAEPAPPAAAPAPPPAEVAPPAAAPDEPDAPPAADPPTAAETHYADPSSLVAPRDAPARAIKSFPSPPDPAFYVPDEQLETPSGTRRVSRAMRAGAGGGAPGGRRARRLPQPPRRGPAGVGAPATRPHRWWPRIAALVVVLIIAAIVVFAIEIFQPFGTSPHGSVTVRIPSNTSSTTVARTLARDGVISSSFFFELRATLDGDRSDIRAGTYHLRQGMGYGAVLARLTTAPKAAKTSQLTLAEGHTRQYVAALLRRQHDVKGDYLADTVRSPILNPRSYGAPRSTRNLEGFLFPDTYSLVDPVHASALVADQLRDFKRRFAAVHLSQAHRLHLSGYDVITIASLIEAESAAPGDDRLVSSVIDNRLRDHMMLQLDSTARYATGNFTKALTVTQLASKSPYNTHTHFGLPPGPINSPGLTALNAAAHPASSHYLYFFSKPCTDKTVFASSYAQFQILLVRDRRLHCPK